MKTSPFGARLFLTNENLSFRSTVTIRTFDQSYLTYLYTVTFKTNQNLWLNRNLNFNNLRQKFTPHIYARHLRQRLPWVTVPAATPCSSMTVRVVSFMTIGISFWIRTTMSYSNSCRLYSFVHGGIPDPIESRLSPSYLSGPTIRFSRAHLSGFLANQVVLNGWLGGKSPNHFLW